MTSGNLLEEESQHNIDNTSESLAQDQKAYLEAKKKLLAAEGLYDMFKVMV